MRIINLDFYQDYPYICYYFIGMLMHNYVKPFVYKPIKQLGLIHYNYVRPIKGGLIYKRLNDIHPSLAKINFYSTFVILVDAACKLPKYMNINSILLAELLSYSFAATAGGLLQGRPDCPAQQNIENKPFVAALGGMANGLMCCLLYTKVFLPATLSLAAPILPVLIPSVPLLLPVLLAQTAFAIFASSAMCNIETKINLLAEKLLSKDWLEVIEKTSTKEERTASNTGGACCSSATLTIT